MRLGYRISRATLGRVAADDRTGADVWVLHCGQLVGVVEEMTTLDGAIIRVLSDGKHYTIKNLYHAILDNATLYEGPIPKSTLWYHLLKLQKEGRIKSVSHDGSNRVEYYLVQSGAV